MKKVEKKVGMLMVKLFFEMDLERREIEEVRDGS